MQRCNSPFSTRFGFHVDKTIALAFPVGFLPDNRQQFDIAIRREQLRQRQFIKVARKSNRKKLAHG